MARVTLDIFSGRPNPVWELDEAALRELLGDDGRLRTVGVRVDRLLLGHRETSVVRAFLYRNVSRRV